MRVITFKADDELIELMERFTKRTGISRSELIRDAIRFYINYYTKYSIDVRTRYVRLD